MQRVQFFLGCQDRRRPRRKASTNLLQGKEVQKAHNKDYERAGAFTYGFSQKAETDNFHWSERLFTENARGKPTSLIEILFLPIKWFS